MRPAIRVQNLDKSYRLGVTHAGSIRELVNRTAAGLKGRSRSNNRIPLPPEHAGRIDSDGLFWALRTSPSRLSRAKWSESSDEMVREKVRFLKILARITYPTAGRVEIHGRVASLLEVGTGFHPELTGRENVYLNGTILGMTRREIDRKFDQIVDFAGVEAFLDTPVKRYSSGMTVRLAFAVAAHLRA